MNYHYDFQEHSRRRLKLTSVPLLTMLSSFQPVKTVGLTGTELRQLEIQEFDLGDEIFSYPPVLASNLAAELSADRAYSDLYLVYRGAVRLLCSDRTHARKVTAVLLEAGDTFGLPCFFCARPLPYWTIAATPCQIARIPAQTLFTLMQQMPQLGRQIAQQEQQREQLIFFRSLTNLSLVSNQQLKRMLLPYLVQQQVCAGELLKQVTSERSGHFWLRSGTIVSQEDAAPQIGDSWGCLGRSPTDWIAQTDLVLYKLPLEHLEAAKLLHLL